MTQQDKDVQEVLDQLSMLAPNAQDAPRSAHEAYANLQNQLTGVRPRSTTINIQRSLKMILRRRSVAVAVSFILLVTVVFSFPVVRTAASDFLGLFRVQKFAPISISPEQLALLEQLAEEGMTPGEFNIRREPGKAIPVDSLAEAGRMTGLKPRKPMPLRIPSITSASPRKSARISRAILSTSLRKRRMTSRTLCSMMIPALNPLLLRSISQWRCAFPNPSPSFARKRSNNRLRSLFSPLLPLRLP